MCAAARHDRLDDDHMFTGDEVDIVQHRARLPQKGATAKAKMIYRWPLFCHESNLTIPVKGRENRVRVAPLLDFSEDDLFVRYTIGIPSLFTQDGFRDNLVERLAGSVPWGDPVVGKPKGESYDVMTVTFCKFELPAPLDYDPSMLHPDPDIVCLGIMAEGSQLLWNLEEKPHGLFAGATGSGKTVAAKFVIAQLLREGWEVVVATPTEADSTFAGFEDHPNFRGFYGSGVDELSELAAFMTAEDDEMGRRESERGEIARAEKAAGRKGVELWGEPAGTSDSPVVWVGRKKFLFADEYTDMAVPDPGDDPDLMASKRVIQAKMQRRVRRGRKTRQHTAIAVQQPDVGAFGEGPVGGRVLRNLGFRLAVTDLSTEFTPVVFPKSKSTALDLLQDPSTPKGRGVARGAVVPDNEFGVTTNDGAVQVPWITDDQLADLIFNGSGRPQIPDATPQVEAGVVAEAERILTEAGSGREWLTPPATNDVEHLATGRPELARSVTIIPDESPWIVEPDGPASGDLATMTEPRPVDGFEMPDIPVEQGSPLLRIYVSAFAVVVVLWVAIIVALVVG